jgi:Uma2 family endonuclease
MAATKYNAAMTQAPVLIQGKRLLPSESPEYIASGPMSFDEYLDWEYEGGLAEWVDGQVFVYVSATFEHQRIQGFLQALLSGWAEITGAGSVIAAPYAVQGERGGSGREPDLLFILRDHAGRLEQRHLTGAADVVIEIVSPDSVARDRITKFREYERAGFAEYWIIDSRPHLHRADFYSLAPTGRYQTLDAENGTFRSGRLPNFWLKVDWLWEAEPRPLAALREILGSL